MSILTRNLTKIKTYLKPCRRFSSRPHLLEHHLPVPITASEAFLKYGVGLLVAPLSILGLGWYTVPTNYTGVVTRYGKFETVKDQGLH